MQKKTIAGTISLPRQKRQRQLHEQLGNFMAWMHRPKDAGEIQKDRAKSVPVGMLPIIF